MLHAASMGNQLGALRFGMCIDMMTFTANLYTRGADEVCRGFDSDGLALVLVLVLASL
jgi:hypothetical protein